MFALRKTINRIHVTPSFLVPWLCISTSKTMFFKKPPWSPQTKINYLESFFYFFFLIVYISEDILISSESLFSTMTPTIYCAIMRKFQWTKWKAKKPLYIVYLVSRKSCPPSKSSFSFVKRPQDSMLIITTEITTI